MLRQFLPRLHGRVVQWLDALLVLPVAFVDGAGRTSRKSLFGSFILAPCLLGLEIILAGRSQPHDLEAGISQGGRQRSNGIAGLGALLFGQLSPCHERRAELGVNVFGTAGVAPPLAEPFGHEAGVFLLCQALDLRLGKSEEAGVPDRPTGSARNPGRQSGAGYHPLGRDSIHAGTRSACPSRPTICSQRMSCRAPPAA